MSFLGQEERVRVAGSDLDDASRRALITDTRVQLSSEQIKTADRSRDVDFLGRQLVRCHAVTRCWTTVATALQ